MSRHRSDQTYPQLARQVMVETHEELACWNEVAVYQGGYGSALAPDPSAPGHFFILTDRGPNFDVPDPGAKGFAVPAYRPHIGRFRMEEDRLVRVAVIPLATAEGRLLSGLPNPPGLGSTGEVPVGLDGAVLPLDPEGVDPEGMTVAPDGSFWVSDEYGPALLHVGPDGRVRERITPFSRLRALPRVFARRWPNRGPEAVAMLPDGRTLAVIPQSALDNPEPGAGERSAVVRLLLFDTVSGASRQHVYLQDEPGLSCSALAAVDATTLVAVEHDRKFTFDPGSPSRVKRIYMIDLDGATDVSDAADGPAGRLFGGRPLEALAAPDLERHGVRPVRKTLLLDLVALGYPHDKPEGLAVIDDRTIALLNDDDFGIASDGRGGIAPKLLPGTDVVDRNTVYFIPVAPLREGRRR